MPAGAVVTVGPARDGVRSYVAFAGGIDVDPVLGSRSTDTLAWVGPPRLAAGQVLAVGTPDRWPRAACCGRRTAPGGRCSGCGRVRAPTGSRPVRGTRLDRATYAVAPDSDRIGLRLDGPRVDRRAGELPSEGMVLGAVQLPPSGQPVVFLADHPPTGGYPVVGVVEDADLDLCAQLRPGDPVVLRTDLSASVLGRRLPAVEGRVVHRESCAPGRAASRRSRSAR